jgi:formylglycine-generating enzyme required for sulfatase activity
VLGVDSLAERPPDGGRIHEADAGGKAPIDSGPGAPEDGSTSDDGGDGGDGGDASPCSDGKCGEPPSCQGSTSLGTTNCGAPPESCCFSPLVESGNYFRSYSTLQRDGGAEGGAGGYPASVSRFRLDRYLVTVGRFRQFVAAWSGSGFRPAAGSGKHAHLNGGLGLVEAGGSSPYESGWVSGWNSLVSPTDGNLTCDSRYATWTSTPGDQENLPINCVTWYEAYAFCIWDEGFLPSEAEWEYAATGGNLQLAYPWGVTDPSAANTYAVYGCRYPGEAGACSGVSNIPPVGFATSGAGVWSQLDLAGSMWEWNADVYGAYVDPCSDCALLSTATSRVTRGGNFVGPATLLATEYRASAAPTSRSYVQGLRCARRP